MSIETVRGLKSDKDEDDVKEDGPKYEENEVNGKFKIMSKWDENLKDPTSTKFKELAASLKEGLLEMLMADENLKEQADYEIDIVGFTYVYLCFRPFNHKYNVGTNDASTIFNLSRVIYVF